LNNFSLFEKKNNNTRWHFNGVGVSRKKSASHVFYARRMCWFDVGRDFFPSSSFAERATDLYGSEGCSGAEEEEEAPNIPEVERHRRNLD
jgi:hypothetical protein